MDQVDNKAKALQQLSGHATYTVLTIDPTPKQTGIVQKTLDTFVGEEVRYEYIQ